MKKSLIIFLLTIVGFVAIVSCTQDNSPNVNFHLAYLPADSVEVPSTMIRGQKYTVTIYYKKPDNCHYFNRIYYQAAQNVYTTAIEAMVLENVNCQPIQNSYPDVTSFDFTVPLASYNSCIFKFYNGSDSSGNDTFIVKNVSVAQ